MHGTCVQCAALERQLSEIKDEIAAEIRRGHRRRADAPGDKASRLSLAKLLSILTQTEDFYHSHKRVFHEDDSV
jgi:hypothetical protein